jgi:hypothetical protein
MASRSEPRLGYVPHFDVMTIDGRHVRYDDIWQRRNLVLVVVTPAERETGSRYASNLEARRAEFEAEETAVVVTTDAVPKLAVPVALVADRWGEVVYLERSSARDARCPVRRLSQHVQG